jgi:tRNA (guanine-N7-)-methyltransferase
VIAVYGLTVIEDNSDVYANIPNNELSIKTHYEGLDIANSNRIYYLQFELPAAILPDKDNELKQLIVEQETNRRRGA